MAHWNVPRMPCMPVVFLSIQRCLCLICRRWQERAKLPVDFKNLKHGVRADFLASLSVLQKRAYLQNTDFSLFAHAQHRQLSGVSSGLCLWARATTHRHCILQLPSFGHRWPDSNIWYRVPVFREEVNRWWIKSRQLKRCKPLKSWTFGFVFRPFLSLFEFFIKLVSMLVVPFMKITVTLRFAKFFRN